MLDLAVERSRCDLVRLRRRKAIELWRGDRGEVGSGPCVVDSRRRSEVRS